jgi:glycine cleavage system transcriptional repressor
MNSQAYLVLVALSPDRPGLVAIVSEYLTARGANIEDSRMAVLGAEFGIMILCSGSEEQVARIEKEIPALELEAGFHILVRKTKSPEEHRRAAVIPCLVRVDAIDHEGIVHAVSLAIHKLGVNIVSLETSSYNAPITGSPLFRLEARLDIPRSQSLASVRATLESVAEHENIDIDVRPLT